MGRAFGEKKPSPFRLLDSSQCFPFEAGAFNLSSTFYIQSLVSFLFFASVWKPKSIQSDSAFSWKHNCFQSGFNFLLSMSSELPLFCIRFR
jgi:hypothetical protein